ncbi:MAG: hypothetical protein IPG90_04240 [Bacteroidetes bacterium]|nr:hypothetical protein [Bacteroidota bacterium]
MSVTSLNPDISRCPSNVPDYDCSSKCFYSTLGRKLVMALTGLFLAVFLLEHLYGNLQLYKMDGGLAFNEYGEFLVHNIVIRTVEFALFGGILLHVIDALFLTLHNRKARPYAMPLVIRPVTARGFPATWV